MLDGEYIPEEHIADGAAVFADAWCDGWRVPEPLSVSEWADRYRIVSRKASAEHGDWRTSRFPYLREIMDCLSVESPIREVDFQKSTQVGGTEILNNLVGYVIDHAPGPMMALHPTLGMAERWSKQRLAPMIEEMACLSSKVAPARQRDSDNTTLLKGFPGGVLSIVGANSSSGLRSMPVKYLFADEVDEYESDLNDQGSALELAERRTTTFSRRKIFRNSTPTVAGASRIEGLVKQGDMRRYFVPCPHCQHMHVLHIDQLTDDGCFVCPENGCLIEEHHKTWMLAHGEWRATRECADKRRASFLIWSAYSPIGMGDSWAEIAEKRAEARANPELEVTFANTILGETYDSSTMRVDADEIETRAGSWKMRSPPPGVLVLTVGVDVQIDRFEILLVGWGRGERGWIVDRVQLPADPTRLDDYDQLDEFMERPILNHYGISMRPDMMFIDSGNWTHEVYAYVRRTRHPVCAVKGLAATGKAIINRPSLQDIKHNGRTIKHGVKLWSLGVNTAKTTLIGRLVADEARESDDRLLHFPEDLESDWYRQLTAETFDERAGRWKKIKGRRNEAIDTLVYAYAAAQHPRVHIHKNRDPEWARLEAIYEPATADLFKPGQAPAAAPDAAAAPANDSRGTLSTPERGTGPNPEPAPAAAGDEFSNDIASSEWSGKL